MFNSSGQSFGFCKGVCYEKIAFHHPVGWCRLWSASQAMAFKPAVLFDMGGKFDKSFNEGIWNGLEKFRKETGIKYREFEVQQEAQREQFLRKLAKRGSDPILAVGFGQAAAVEKIAKEFPNTRFSIIDVDWLNLPNVQGIAFKEHEGSFLVFWLH